MEFTPTSQMALHINPLLQLLRLQLQLLLLLLRCHIEAVKLRKTHSPEGGATVELGRAPLLTNGAKPVHQRVESPPWSQVEHRIAQRCKTHSPEGG